MKSNFTFAALGFAACTIFAATPVLAVQGDPIPGIDVSIEQSPGGIMVTAGNCPKAGGKVTQHADGHWYCDMPAKKPVTMTPTPAPTPPSN